MFEVDYYSNTTLDYFDSNITHIFYMFYSELEVSTLEKILTSHPNKTIIIQRSDTFLYQNELDLLAALHDKYSNFEVELQDFGYVPFLKEHNIPYRFCYTPDNIDDLYIIAEKQPTAIQVTGLLGFSLDKVSSFLHKKDIELVVCPNESRFGSEVSLSSIDSNISSIKSFFIRPEDLNYYSRYVDRFHIAAASASNYSTIYSIYKSGRWLGNLSDIIMFNNSQISNKFYMPSFGTVRSTCEKRCLLNPQSCHVCDNFALLSTLEKKVMKEKIVSS